MAFLKFYLIASAVYTIITLIYNLRSLEELKGKTSILAIIIRSPIIGLTWPLASLTMIIVYILNYGIKSMIKERIKELCKKEGIDVNMNLIKIKVTGQKKEIKTIPKNDYTEIILSEIRFNERFLKI